MGALLRESQTLVGVLALLMKGSQVVGSRSRFGRTCTRPGQGWQDHPEARQLAQARYVCLLLLPPLILT